MISNKLTIRSILMSVMLISMLGCRASGNHRAPIEDRSGSSRQSAAYDRESSSRPNGSRRTEQQDGRAQIHVVQKGDTLYSIAFENGMIIAKLRNRIISRIRQRFKLARKLNYCHLTKVRTIGQILNPALRPRLLLFRHQ